MYSVEDLLISHGYKLPKHTTTSSIPTPAPTSSSHQAPSSSPPSYSKHHEVLENVPGPRTVNGYERGPYGAVIGTRQPQVYRCPNNNNNEPRDRNPSRREGKSRTDSQSLTSDSGFCDGTKGPQSQGKDVSYWRRRGQDFTVLLDYADFREPHVGGQGSYCRPEGSQQARGQELSVEDRQRAAQERQRWAAHVQAQAQAQVHAQTHSREREAALHQWRMETEKKCQSLGTDEWCSAVKIGRQLSQNESERWAQEQQRLHVRTPEGMVVHPRTKAKSQSLPRMLQPESLQYVDIAPSGQEFYRRVNGHPLSHHDLYRTPHWPENGRPASANQLSMTPKPRFTRPPRPPSYEMHQQIRGSCEVLSGRDSVAPQARDRTPLPISRTGDPQLEYFAQESGPPGYIPPPSYKRAPIMGGGRRGYGGNAVDYRYKGGVYQHIHVAPDGSHWFTRHPVGLWTDHPRDRNVSGQKQIYPVYTSQEHPGGGIQYIPFDDPRIRHISSALGENSLTDADKIRHICNELPSVTVSEPASNNSAFLPPPLGPSISAKLVDDANQTSSSNLDNDNNRWHSDLHNETVDNFPLTDQNCNNRYPKKHRHSPSPSSAFQAPIKRTFSHQGSRLDQSFAETITQVKKIVPDSGTENNRNTKRRVSETIFCLVSVPVHTPTSINKDLAADQNNNETVLGLTTDTFAVGLKESLNVRSKSVNEIPIKYHHSHTSSTSSMRNYKRAPLRKEIIDAWTLQASEDKELCYAGSWPGNQYRNQETQTGSPLSGVKSPEPQNPLGSQEPVQSVSDTITESCLDTDNSSSYGYLMAGQKNLRLSSNSAFSRLNLSPTQLPLLQPSQEPSSPPKVQNQRDQQPLSPRKSNSSPSDSTDQVAFGQFLLKPVNRRPCDAIGELESINKEMEDTISKRPNVTKVYDLNGMNERLEQFKSGAHLTVGPEPGREAISLPPMHIEKHNHSKVRSKSLASTPERAPVNITKALPRPHFNIPPTNEPPRLENQGARDSYLLPLLSQHNESNQLYRQDIPVPQESLLRDVGLTVYTETPGGPGEPIQRSISVPSPLDLKELNRSVQELWKTRTALVKNGGSPEHRSNKEPQAELETGRNTKSDNVTPSSSSVNLRICRSKSESSKPPPTNNTRLTKQVSFVFEKDNDSDERYTISEPLTYKNESTIADRHLDKLLMLEKANSLPAQDLSNLYEVKCAEGIPENESIEQRAARILGIPVPVEALGVADKQSEDKCDDGDAPVSEKLQSQAEETLQMMRGNEKVKQDTLPDCGTKTEEVTETEPKVDNEEDRQKHNTDNDGSENQDTDIQSMLVLDLPEFPPSKLPLSLPITPDEKLALSMCNAEKRCRGCKLIESLQDKLNCSSSASSLGRSTTDRMARMKELDSVSRIRRLSLKGSDTEKGADVQKQSKGHEKEEEGFVEERRAAEGKKLMGEEGKEEENPDESETILLGDHSEACTPKKRANEEMCEEEQRQEAEEVIVEIALKAKIGGSNDANIALKAEEAEGEVGMKVMENDEERPVEIVGENATEVNRAEATDGEMMPKPRRPSRLQKPPLLPKPRSVPKREITLPVSFSTSTCSPSNVEDEEKHCVSECYDPSRVERV